MSTSADDALPLESTFTDTSFIGKVCQNSNRKKNRSPCENCSSRRVRCVWIHAPAEGIPSLCKACAKRGSTECRPRIQVPKRCRAKRGRNSLVPDIKNETPLKHSVRPPPVSYPHTACHCASQTPENPLNAADMYTGSLQTNLESTPSSRYSAQHYESAPGPPAHAPFVASPSCLRNTRALAQPQDVGLPATAPFQIRHRFDPLSRNETMLFGTQDHQPFPGFLNSCPPMWNSAFVPLGFEPAEALVCSASRLPNEKQILEPFNEPYLPFDYTEYTHLANGELQDTSR